MGPHARGCQREKGGCNEPQGVVLWSQVREGGQGEDGGAHLRGSHPGKDFIPETARGYDFCPNGLLELPHSNGTFLLFLFVVMKGIEEL